MNFAGASPSLDAHWGQIANDKFLKSHPDYRVSQGDVLVFLIGHFPLELTGIPLCIFTPSKNSQLLLIGAYNTETRQAQSGELKHSTTRYPTLGVFKLA